MSTDFFKNQVDRVALVTGGSRGIGYSIVKKLISTGIKVISCSRNIKYSTTDKKIDCIKIDVGNSKDIEKLYTYIKKNYGKLDFLVNNAGIQIEKTITETTDKDWEKIINTNARGIFLTSRAFIPLMIKNGGGAIVNIGSISGIHSDPSMALYNASKAFVHGLTRSIAVDYGHQGIRCNAVCPGWIMTELADNAFNLAKDPLKAKHDALARHPLGRFGKPNDIAKAVTWLLSDDSQFITGQALTIDGGLISASPIRTNLN